jgi:putative flippase GtrA
MARLRRFALVGVAVFLVAEVTAYLAVCNFMDSVD